MERFAELKRILIGAIERPASERDAWIDRECGDDEALRSEVRAKLAHLSRDASVLMTGGIRGLVEGLRPGEDAPTIASGGSPAAPASAPRSAADTPDPPSPAADAATVASDSRSGSSGPAGAPGALANYRILGHLGQGGMGVVYLAEQQSPRRQVALKVIRGGEFVDEMRVKMFQREAQTLGRLKHPNIAAIYESGRTDDGQHFFAMELVRGETLDRYLAARGPAGSADFTGTRGPDGVADPTALPPDELRSRLRLFRRIADAVHYAHQRGVIHRDLKPSNIVVTHEASDSSRTSRDAGPDVKVLDFGLARMTDADVHATTLSEVGAIKGTLPYMSPEQARGNPEEIDLRTDVYALGVILYEMLTGTLPYDTAKGSLVQAIRVICEEPAGPMRGSTAGKGIDADVETICLKALEKEPQRRYSTAAAMADDVERYLRSEPIAARPPSTIYQLRKFAARNRALVGGVLATFLVLVAGVVVSTTLGLREARQRQVAEEARQAAERETERATAVQEFLQEMITTADPFESKGPMTTVSDVLESAAERIEEEFQDRPAVEASLRYSIGRTYVGFTQWEKATPQLERALELFRQVYPGEDREDTAECLRYLGECHLGLNRPECIPVLRESVAMHRRLHGEESVKTGAAMHDLAFGYQVIARQAEGAARDSLLEKSAELYLESQVIFREVHGEDHEAYARCLHAYSVTLWHQGKQDEALAQVDRAIDITERAGAEVYLQSLFADWGAMLRLAGRTEEALEATVRRLELSEKVYGDQWPHVGHSLIVLGDLSLELGRPREAISYLTDAQAFFEDLYGTDCDEYRDATELLERARAGRR